MSTLIMDLPARNLPELPSRDFLAAADAQTLALWEEYLSLYDFLDAEGVAQFLLSGFAIDLSIGGITRAHGDLDIMIDDKDVARSKALFETRGYSIVRLGPKRDFAHAFIAQRGALHVDVGGILADGDRVFDLVDLGSEYTWPAHPSDLLWSRAIDGRSVHFVSPYVAYTFKTRSKSTRLQERLDREALLRAFPDAQHYARMWQESA